jgi:hypothetical protein
VSIAAGSPALAVLDGYGLDSAYVAGASMGGMMAQWLGVPRRRGSGP